MTTTERSVEEIDPLKDPNAEIEITCPNCQKDFDAGYIVRNEFKIALTAERQRCEEIVLKGERRRIIEQIRDERDTYWKERVRKEKNEVICFLDELLREMFSNLPDNSDERLGAITALTHIRNEIDAYCLTHNPITNEDKLK